MPSTLRSSLHIRGLELSLHLGWSDKEQAQERVVLLDLAFHFPTPPKACETDALADTVCYATLSAKIRELVAGKKYRLIEHLAADIYSFVRQQISTDAKLTVRITKFPAIGGLKDGVSFEYGDEIISW